MGEPLVRTSNEIDEAARACAALELLLSSRDTSTDETNILLSELRDTLQIPLSKQGKNLKASPNGSKRKAKGLPCVGVVVNPSTKTFVLPSECPPPSKKRGQDIYNDSENSEADESEHNENCEVCNQGGELLCCDTCSLVFHPTCCRPALRSIPDHHVEWSCAYCVVDGTIPGSQVGYDIQTAKKHVEAMKILGESNKPRYRGVVCKGIRFRAQIQINGKQINLGKYTTEIEAAHKYDERAREAFGVKAKLNFPKSGELSHFEVPLNPTPTPQHNPITTKKTDVNTDESNVRSKRSRSSSQEIQRTNSSDSEEPTSTVKKYGTSADQFLFNLDSTSSQGLPASPIPHHTRHSNSRRPSATVSLSLPSDPPVTTTVSRKRSSSNVSSNREKEDKEEKDIVEKSNEDFEEGGKEEEIETHVDCGKVNEKESETTCAIQTSAVIAQPNPTNNPILELAMAHPQPVPKLIIKGRGRGRRSLKSKMEEAEALERARLLPQIMTCRQLYDDEIQLFDQFIEFSDRTALEALKVELLGTLAVVEALPNHGSVKPPDPETKTLG